MVESSQLTTLVISHLIIISLLHCQILIITKNSFTNFTETILLHQDYPNLLLKTHQQCPLIHQKKAYLVILYLKPCAILEVTSHIFYIFCCFNPSSSYIYLYLLMFIYVVLGVDSIKRLKNVYFLVCEGLKTLNGPQRHKGLKGNLFQSETQKPYQEISSVGENSHALTETSLSDVDVLMNIYENQYRVSLIIDAIMRPIISLVEQFRLLDRYVGQCFFRFCFGSSFLISRTKVG